MTKPAPWIVAPTEPPTPADHPANRLLAAVRSAQWPAVEELWLSLPELRPTPAGEFRTFFHELSRRKGAPEVSGLIELLLAAGIDDAFAPAAVQIVVQAQGYVGAAGATLHEPMSALVAKSRPDDAEVLARLCGFQNGASFDACLGALARFLHLKPGAVLRHKFYEAGLVKTVDLAAGQMTMDFPGTQYAGIVVKFQHADELLTPLPADHFDVMRLADPQGVRTMADEEPGLLVRRIARARMGRVSQADLKTILTANVMSDAEFKNWWGKRRADVVRDPLLDVEGKGARCVFAVRAEPKPYFREAVEAFVGAATFDARLEAVRAILRAARDGAFPAEAFASLVPPFQAAVIDMPKMARSERIAWELMAQLVLSAAPAGFKLPYSCNVGAELKASVRPAETVVAIAVPEFIVGILPDIRETFPADWPRHLHDIAELAPPRVAARMIQELDASGHQSVAADALGRIISFPERNQEAYVWAMRGLLDGELKGIPVGLDRHHLIEDLLTLLEEVERGGGSALKVEEKERRALGQRVSKLLAENQHHHIAAFVTDLPVEEARAFYEGLLRRRLDQAFLNGLRQSLRKTRNDLEVEHAHTEEAVLEAVLMSTEEAHAAKLQEYRHLKNVDIPANSKAIGVARELGDLRENAEYQTAKDMQKVLFARLEELELQLHRARVVRPENVDTSSVTFGTTFTLRGDDGTERRYTLLGPWESNPDKGIISYQAPLGKSFYRKKVGDKVGMALPDGGIEDLTITAIERAF